MTKKDKAHLLRMTRAQLVEKIEVLFNQNKQTVSNSNEIIKNQKEYISKLRKEIDALEVDKSQLEDVIDENVMTMCNLTRKINIPVAICSFVAFIIGLFIGILF